MRSARIKVSVAERDSVYHCMTRTVNGEFLLDDTAKEVLRKQLWQIADFCGVHILTFAILSNHFHVLLRVPKACEISNAELLRRYSVLYPKPTRFQQAKLEVIQAWLHSDDPEGLSWRKRQLALMGDVSQFMKLLKQRFSIWFNHTHNRYGTLWAERFKSVLVEPSGRIVETMAAYIDLNAVRAGLVADPKDYRFCGYAEAVAGNPRAQSGIASILAGPAAQEPDTAPISWDAAQGNYRLTLFGIGSGARPGEGSVSPDELQKVVKSKGHLPRHVVLRCRIKHFTHGAVLGGKSFVAEHLAAYREKTGRRRKTDPVSLPPVTDWGGDFATLRSIRSTG